MTTFTVDGQMAEQAGLNEAVMHGRLAAALHDYGVEHQGRRWLLYNAAAIQAGLASWWSPNTTRRILKSLIKQGLAVEAEYPLESGVRWIALNELSDWPKGQQKDQNSDGGEQ